MSKVALALMVKDSEPFDMLARCLRSSAKYVDGLYITITHTTKNPSKEAKDKARELKVYCLSNGMPEPEISYFKWVKDFSAGRNFNWSQVPEEFDWIFWLDTDDILVNGSDMDKMVSLAEENKFSAVFLNYIYQADVDLVDGKYVLRNILIEHLRERLIRNDGSYKWEGPIHETMIEQRQTNKTDYQGMYVLHLSDHERSSKAIHRNIEILENTLNKQGNQQDPRIVYYLGKSYFDLRTPEYQERAKELILKYLEGSETNVPSGWSEERAQAWEYLSEIYREKGQFNNAVKALANAIIEEPKFPQFYVDMALVYVYKKDWKKALHWARMFDKIPYPKTTLVLNPRDMQARLHEVMFNIGINTGNLELAWASVVKLRELFPKEKSVQDRLEAITAAKKDNEIAHALLNVANYLKNTGQENKIQELIKAVPANMENEPIMMSLRREFTPPRTWEKDEIAIVCGPGFENWDPTSLKDGIGGSEEAVIRNSRELAKLGWNVTVYADPKEEYVEEFNGKTITYKPHFYFNPQDKFNVLIGWRMIGFFDRKWDAKKTYLWLHDVQNPLEYTKERVDNIDKIFVLSEAHKKTILNDANKEYLPDDKFLLTGNGINVEEIEEMEDKIERDPHNVIWTSSYDRGLEHLLDMWPTVLEKVPDATLSIYYGWNLFDKVYHNNPERQAWKAKINEKMKQKGITHYGRVGQDEILRATLKAGVWAYPTHFYEISCITAMKGQACGAIPVVTDFAALQETVQHGVKIDVSDEDIFDKGIKREFVNQLCKVLNLGKAQDDVREPMVKWARNKFSWSGVAAQWDKEFRGGK